VCLLAAGNAPIFTRDGVVLRPVTGVRPSELVLAWREGDRRPLVLAFAASTRWSGQRDRGLWTTPDADRGGSGRTSP
jgi:hypothetical protein